MSLSVSSIFIFASFRQFLIFQNHTKMNFEGKNNELSKTSVNCFDKKCFAIVNNKEVILDSNKVNKINPEIVFKIPEGQLIKLISHFNDQKVWKIMGHFFYPDSLTNEVTFPILTSQKHTLHAGDIICHVQMIAIDEVFNQLKGKNAYILTF